MYIMHASARAVLGRRAELELIPCSGSVVLHVPNMLSTHNRRYSTIVVFVRVNGRFGLPSEQDKLRKHYLSWARRRRWCEAASHIANWFVAVARNRPSQKLYCVVWWIETQRLNVSRRTLHYPMSIRFIERIVKSGFASNTHFSLRQSTSHFLYSSPNASLVTFISSKMHAPHRVLFTCP